MKFRLKKSLIKILKSTFIILGVFFTIMLILSFTSLPFWMYYYLGASQPSFEKNPDYIVVLGGSGIPSESGLMRTYKASQVSKRYPNSKIIIALPGDISDPTSSINLMRHDIIIKGVDSLNIILESNGLNTRMQALEISKLINFKSNLLLVTSPEHMYRAIRVFKTAGMENTQGESAFEQAIESSLIYDDSKMGGNNYILDMGDNTQLRYQFWNHFKYQVIVYREYMAIAYYKIKGWI